MKLSKILLISTLPAFFLLDACRKKEVYPPEPAIQFKSFDRYPNSQGIDEKGVLTISFTDGDGDMGLDQGDTTGNFSPDSTFYYNFFIRYFEKQKGTMTEVILPFTNNARIPLLSNRNTSNMALKGDIAIELYINNPFSAYDTIMYEAWIADRALHVSNVIQTPEIILKKH